MTRERKEEVVLIALALSCAVHVGLMMYARPKIMTSVTGRVSALVSRGPMRIVRNVPRPETVRIDAVKDLEATREAPVAATTELPVSEAGGPAAIAAEPAEVRVAPIEVVPPDPAKPVFDVSPIRLDDRVSAKIPMSAIAAPSASVPEFTAAPAAKAPPVGRPPAVAANGNDADSVFLPSLIDRELNRRPDVKPAETVAKIEEEARPVKEFKPKLEFSAKVDEQLVAEEKTAVRDLVDARNPTELKPFVNVAASSSVENGWRYYRVMITPRTSLPVVPKDVVLVIDASGSIGQDRMGSIRGASKRLLRTVTNSDDRFNLVAFRDRFSYAFRTWQSCTQDAFDRGDRWLSNLAAHGRTDVFSTIRSLLTLPRDPTRPLIALVVTDGDANLGVVNTSELLSRFTALNDGLVSVYMYGVRSSANRELIDVLTHGNRGESLIFEGFRWNAGNGMEKLSERFRDPVLSDLRVVFAADSKAEAYPRLLRNVYRGDTHELLVRTPANVRAVSFSLRGLNGRDAYEGFFRISEESASLDLSVPSRWEKEKAIDARLR